MTHHDILTLLGTLSLLGTLACTERGPAIEPDPLPCGYDGQTLEDGAEVESIDGCMTLACDDGLLVTVEDRRATLAGDLELASQEAVDAQSCLGVVEGTVRISGTAADLTPLATLYRVGAGLEITGTQAVTLAGLEGVQEVGGAIVIADNPALSTLAFQSMMSAFGDVTIQNNDALASLAGAEFIGNCASCMATSGRPHELVGSRDAEFEPVGDGGIEPSGGTFFGNILIADNDVLTDVLAMSNLYYAWSDVRFRSNAALTSLTGLQLMEVRGSLEVSGHASMAQADADAFALNVSILGTTTICGNLGGEACP